MTGRRRSFAWLDSLFARIFLLQLATGLLLVIVFAVLLFGEQSSIFARSVAPQWVAVLKPVQDRLLQGNPPAVAAHQTITNTLNLRSGPLPDDASIMPAVPRYRMLLAELRSQGLQVRRLAISGHTGSAVTWVELDVNGQLQWVGVQNDFERTDTQLRGTLSLVCSVLIFMLGSAWMSRRIAKPLRDLQKRVQAFSHSGEAMGPATTQGPSEVRDLSRQFGDFARQRAQQDEARDIMLSGISHDLRSPLARIRLGAALLPNAEGVGAARDSIVRNVQIADQLVGSFLALGRASAEPLQERVNLTGLVLDMLDHGEHAGVIGPPADQPALWLQPASSTALQRVLVNLLENANKYGALPVIVSLRRTVGQVTLTVRDHGPGIAPDQREKLCEPFFRGASERNAPGTGLGLAIVERSVRRHGGTLQLLDAAPGLAVTITLPLA